MPAHTIQEVLQQLDQIIQTSKQEGSPNGYFAALYRGVTQTVADKLGTGYFEDDARMERLDVVFANRYLQAYKQYQTGETPTKSWALAFQQAEEDRLIVLQHLLLGMNAHINLDLGIAAAEIADPDSIAALQADFRKINELLASLVDRVQRQLIAIWPNLYWILKRTGQVDDYIVDFSMEIARENAWQFALRLSGQSSALVEQLIVEQDDRTQHLGNLISRQKGLKRWFILFIRWGEKGTTTEKIARLSN